MKAILVNADGTTTTQAFLGGNTILSYDLKRKWQGYEIASRRRDLKGEPIGDACVVYYEVPVDG